MGIYLIEREGKDICRHIFLSVDIVNLFDPVVVYTHDAQVKFVNTQDVSQSVDVTAKSGAAKGHHPLEISKYYSHSEPGKQT